MIAGGHQAATALVPDQNGEHPTELSHAIRAKVLVEVAITSVSDRVAKRCPRASRGGLQHLEVVDLPAQNDRDAPVLVVDRLPARHQIDSAEPAVAEPGEPLGARY